MLEMCEPIIVGFPLMGEWYSPNTPGAKIPSHGTGQLGTIDLDHIYNAASIRNKYGLNIAIHANDALFLENPTIDMVLGNFQFKSTLSRPISKMMKHLLKKTSTKQIMSFHKLSPDILLSHNFDLKEYGLNATVSHIPGHTSGSVGILFESGNFISGDTFTNQNRPTTAPNAYDFRELAKYKMPSSWKL